MQGLKARIKELEELNHRLLAELRGKQVEGASGSAGAGGSGGAGEDVVGGAGTGGEGIGGKGTKRRRERDEEDAGESALKQVFKKAKLNEFNGEKKTGEDLEAWIEELEDFFALREFSEEAKAKVAIVQLRSVAKLWWKSYMQTRSRVGPVLWEEFRDQAEKRYCSPHYNMEKKMEFYNFKQRNALKSKFIEGLREELKYQVKGSGCTDFLDAVAKAENFEKMEEFTMKKAASARNRVIATGHRPQGSTVPSSRFNSNQTWVNYGQRNNNNNNQRIANNNQRPKSQVNGGQNDNQKKRQPVRWQQDSEFLERARRLGLCFRCGEQGHRTFECPNKAITAPMQAKVTELDATIEEASEEERDELRRNSEQAFTLQGGILSGLDLVSRIHGRRSTDLGQELEACERKLQASQKENAKLQEELSEVYSIKSKFAEQLKSEVQKSAGLEKEVKYFQKKVAAALSDRDRSVVEVERLQRKRDGLIEKVTDLQDRLDHVTSEYCEEKGLCEVLYVKLEKLKEENELHKKVTEKFWKVQEQATKTFGVEKIQDKADLLLQESEVVWHYGEAELISQSEANQIQAQEELAICQASLANLQIEFETEFSARKQVEVKLLRCKKHLFYLTELIGKELQELNLLKGSLQKEVVSFFCEEKSWILSLQEFLHLVTDVDQRETKKHAGFNNLNKIDNIMQADREEIIIPSARSSCSTSEVCTFKSLQVLSLIKVIAGSDKTESGHAFRDRNER
ncbi:hypothetical protein L7F22_009007 [Adiantum nelumboides]|nr:hypothetical protein [Adiantum nelumboides]